MLAARRRVHRWLWLFLAPALVALLVAALAARREAPRGPLDPALAPVTVPDDLAPKAKG